MFFGHNFLLKNNTVIRFRESVCKDQRRRIIDILHIYLSHPLEKKQKLRDPEAVYNLLSMLDISRVLWHLLTISMLSRALTFRLPNAALYRK